MSGLASLARAVRCLVFRLTRSFRVTNQLISARDALFDAPQRDPKRMIRFCGLQQSGEVCLGTCSEAGLGVEP